MGDQLKLRGGTTAEHAAFIGAPKEITVDTSKNCVVVHDGVTAGGHALLREKAGQYRFNAPSAEPNTLDHYEEGVFVPQFADAQSGGNVAATSIGAGRYTRIGNRCHVTIYMENIDTTGLVAGNAAWIRNLPFAASNAALLRVAGLVIPSNVTFGAGQLTAMLLNGHSALRLWLVPSAGAGGVLVVSNFASGSADLYITLTYEV